jgi:hypothetical protein
LKGATTNALYSSFFSCILPADISDTEERPHTATPPPASSTELEARQQALNYSALAAAASAPNGQDPSLSSTETLLRNIQGLLKVAADNARQQERQITFEKGMQMERVLLPFTLCVCVFIKCQ